MRTPGAKARQLCVGRPSAKLAVSKRQEIQEWFAFDAAHYLSRLFLRMGVTMTSQKLHKENVRPKRIRRVRHSKHGHTCIFSCAVQSRPLSDEQVEEGSLQKGVHHKSQCPEGFTLFDRFNSFFNLDDFGFSGLCSSPAQSNVPAQLSSVRHSSICLGRLSVDDPAS